MKLEQVEELIEGIWIGNTISYRFVHKTTHVILNGQSTMVGNYNLIQNGSNVQLSFGHENFDVIHIDDNTLILSNRGGNFQLHRQP